MKTRTLLILLLTAQLGRGQDLPYDSGSTGADGPFTVNLFTGIGAREGHSMAYDQNLQQLVVYGGGYHSSAPNGSNYTERTDTHVFDGVSWAQAANGGISPRRLGAMVYDSNVGKTFMMGGLFASSVYHQIYSWDGSSWTLISPSGTPPARYGHALVYDATRQESVLFGGWSGSASLGDTRTFDGVATWTAKAPASPPSPRYYHQMTWDAAREEVVLFGGYLRDTTSSSDETWVWNGTEWTQKSPATTPPARHLHAMAFDATNNRVVMFGGWSEPDNILLNDTWVWDGTDWTELPTTDALIPRSHAAMAWDSTNDRLYLVGGRDYQYGQRQDTWVWDDVENDWVQIGGPRYMVDMSEKPDGVWHHTSINVPAGITVNFVPNANNAPVTWLATDDVVIDGTLSVDGCDGFLRDNTPFFAAPGGPGGFAGGIGGNRIELYNSTAGTPGLGPGGGGPGLTNNQNGGNGLYQGVYGNPYIVPLLGGSGGGAGAVYNTTSDGGNGGGGGGAILIASSRDVTINGVISADGGYFGRNRSHSASSAIGGYGSGGAVKVVADRINGTGNIRTRNGQGATSSNRGGYVRLESYLRPFDISGSVTTGQRSNAAPVFGVDYGSPAALVITSVDGEGVASPPTGSFATPDVVFSEAGDVEIVVTATNVPDGTPVTLRIIHSAGSINLPGGGPEVTLSGGTATFSTSIPAGFGTIQAFASYEIVPTAP